MPKDHKETVLVVEDEVDNREIIRTVVEELAGLNALVAENGQQALSEAHEHKPDLILMDMMLPVLDGFQACERLKKDPETRDIPIIALTALTRPQDRKRALEAGCSDYVDKPFDLDLLTQKILSSVKAKADTFE
jgi:CheY-like chemotaxis protein